MLTRDHWLLYIDYMYYNRCLVIRAQISWRDILVYLAWVWQNWNITCFLLVEVTILAGVLVSLCSRNIYMYPDNGSWVKPRVSQGSLSRLTSPTRGGGGGWQGGGVASRWNFHLIHCIDHLQTCRYWWSWQDVRHGFCSVCRGYHWRVVPQWM